MHYARAGQAWGRGATAQREQGTENKNGLPGHSGQLFIPSLFAACCWSWQWQQQEKGRKDASADAGGAVVDGGGGGGRQHPALQQAGNSNADG